MFAFSRAPMRASVTGFVKPVLVISLAALLAACSSAKQPAGPQVFSWLAPEPPQPAPIVQAEVELEDDGLPPQADPAAGIRRMPDDPSAPWSPNYGRSAAGAGDVGVPSPAPTSVADDDGLPPIKSPEGGGRDCAAAAAPHAGGFARVAVADVFLGGKLEVRAMRR